jgi:hemolysin activation/secretion protein
VVGERTKYDGYVTADNHGTRYVGPYQFQAGANMNGVLGWEEQTGVRFVTTSQSNELKLGAINHDVPLTSEGTRALMTFQKSYVQPAYTLKPFDLDSEQLFTGVMVSHPLLRSRRENLSIRGRLDYRNAITEQNHHASVVSEDRIRAVRVGSSFDVIDAALGRTAISLIGVELSQGLDVLGARGTGSAHLSRPEGKTEFTKINFEAQRLQTLGGGFNILVAAVAQFAWTDLLSAEQFAFGGAIFGRGLDPAEFTGDNGLAGKVELQWGDSSERWWPLRDYQLYAFYDAGTARRKSAFPGFENGQTTGTTTGFGVRLNLVENLSANLEMGMPLVNSVAARGEDGKEPRFFFSVIGRF